jgi:Bacterial Ig-like domain (group 3)
MRLKQHVSGATALRLVGVTAAAATACALLAGPASAGTASVTRYATTTVVSVPKTGYTHTSITFSATEKGIGGNPTGTVRFWLGTRPLCIGSLYRRKTSCKAQFTNPGTKTITAKYSGNRLHKPSSGTATIKITTRPPGATTTTITSISPDRDPAGDAAAVTVKVTSAIGTPTGSVVVSSTTPGDTAPGYTCKITTLVNGTGSCNIVPPAPTYGDVSLEAAYSGDATHLASATTGEYTLVVPDATTTSLTISPAAGTVGTAESLTATVVNQAADDISPAAGGTGTVTFYYLEGPAVLPLCNDVPLTYAGTGNNVATCSWTPTVAAEDTVIAYYSGDENNLLSHASEPVTIGS